MSLSSSIRQRRKDARPSELLDAALALFVEKGFAATKSEEVAARAGVSKGTLYLYFPSKEELLKAVIRHTLLADIARGAERLAQENGPTGELLVELMTDWWVNVYESPSSAIFKLVMTEVRNFPDIGEFYLHEVIEPGHVLIGGLIQRGIDRGEFRPVDVDGVVHSIVLPMVMLCLHKHSMGACGFADSHLTKPAEFIRQHLDLILNGLRPGPTAPPVL
ncbi:MAG TPA: TetR/AcrR family transcriptional regulator [Ideonella sp.]|uniref:TetR/AcrR family transcriptional regulator n=1 Tax=Ideonella sp. TaxID=1929293 RepID=UPI002E3409DF|nr:TetR/AcrR family transcriptional regulator [Ideonella sp.]HEX5686500.1 TetR/AcrR family transcriptional regulator [Ideonella sp.]